MYVRSLPWLGRRVGSNVRYDLESLKKPWLVLGLACTGLRVGRRPPRNHQILCRMSARGCNFTAFSAARLSAVSCLIHRRVILGLSSLSALGLECVFLVISALLCTLTLWDSAAGSLPGV
ncbi:hypothetical protein L209DRAFT_34360 [Thermothelomyces heterothallicus CBS 203.75]